MYVDSGGSPGIGRNVKLEKFTPTTGVAGSRSDKRASATPSVLAPAVLIQSDNANVPIKPRYFFITDRPENILA
jgi:hypothetical protein